MEQTLDLVGAVVAIVVLVASIATFVLRLTVGPDLPAWTSVPILLMILPLAYLLATASGIGRPPLYLVQVGTMLVWLVLLLVLDHVVHYDWRGGRATVVPMVALYFAGLGGMIGVASIAGRSWGVAAIGLFLVAAVLAIVQRAVTGR